MSMCMPLPKRRIPAWNNSLVFGGMVFAASIYLHVIPQRNTLFPRACFRVSRLFSLRRTARDGFFHPLRLCLP